MSKSIYHTIGEAEGFLFWASKALAESDPSRAQQALDIKDRLHKGAEQLCEAGVVSKQLTFKAITV